VTYVYPLNVQTVRIRGRCKVNAFMYGKPRVAVPVLSYKAAGNDRMLSQSALVVSRFGLTFGSSLSCI
jgi:hypothetical protein